MRADLRNTGRSPLPDVELPSDPEVRLRRWSTGNGIFSTPVIGVDETIYVGSADKNFYAFDPLIGEARWQFATGECIDSAGCIAADGTVFFPSCDATIYALDPHGRERWRLNVFERRKHFTPSTIFWWEGNVVLGPNGWLYAGNDDFNFYAIEPGRGVRWSYLTGLHIWSAPAFGSDGALVFFSFDRNCYKLDLETGRLCWRANTGNFVVSSPAIGEDGTIYFGSFDRHVYALDGKSGFTLWKLATGAPIYASPALAADGMVYIGSSDGCLYAIDGRGGRKLWTFYTGDAIRASASIGPDPERRCPYLVYFGSGNGLLYCVEPSGRRRWSYSTAAEGSELDSPNINASIALGRAGIAAATASGKVFYVPYRYYLDQPDDPALDRNERDGYPEKGIFLYALSSGGAMSAVPVSTDSAAIVVDPTQPLSFRLLARDGGQTQPLQVDSQDLQVSIEPSRSLRVTLQPDRSQLNVIPLDFAAGVTDAVVNLRARIVAGPTSHSTIEATQAIRYVPAIDAPPIEALPELPFRVTHMSIYDPAIVPSFDQIGIASLTLRVRVIHGDAESHKVVAWGVEKFGVAEEGEAVQVAVPRHLFYAFSGSYQGGRLNLEARDCAFELTAFPLPLDLFRLAGTWQGAEGPRAGSSLLAELDVHARLRWHGGSPRPAANAAMLSQLRDFARKWMPDTATAIRSLPLLGRLLARSLSLAAQIVRRRMYGPWGLIGEDGWFRGVGSFRSSADEGLPTSAFEVTGFHYAAGTQRIVGEVRARQGHERIVSAVLPGIVVIDLGTHEPIALRYTGATEIERSEGTIRATLRLAESFAPRAGRYRAILLADTTPLATLDLEGQPSVDKQAS